MFVKFVFGLKSATFKVQLFSITEPESKFVVLTWGGEGEGGEIRYSRVENKTSQ